MLPAIVHINNQSRLQRGDGPVVSACVIVCHVIVGLTFLCVCGFVRL